MSTNRKSKKRRYAVPVRDGCSAADEMFASYTSPMSLSVQHAYFIQIYSALEDICSSPDPRAQSWTLINDVHNLMETLVLEGICEDEDRLLDAADKALSRTGAVYLDTKKLSFEAAELDYLRAMVADYESIVSAIPHRAVIQLHRKTTTRMAALKKKSSTEHCESRCQSANHLLICETP